MTEVRETVICPICLGTIVSRVASPIEVRSAVDSRSGDASGMLTQMILSAQAAHAEDMQRVLTLSAEHYREHHRLRLWAWQKTRWAWLMRGKWPWTRLSVDLKPLEHR